jgi:hypothetical protein
MISAAQWNRNVAPLNSGKWRAPAGGITMAQTPFGRCLSAERGSAWRHPWFTELVWVGEQSRWVAGVRPGFVNGQCPVYRQRVADLVDSNRWGFGVNPLSGKPYFSSWIFAHKQEEWATRYVDTPLYAKPAIDLSWRNVGFDGPGSVVPDFFKKLGVQSAPAGLEADLMAGTYDVSKNTPAAGNRLLRASEIVLHQPRTALTAQVAATPTGMRQYLGMQNAPAGDVLRVFAKSSTTASGATGIDPVSLLFEEDSWDEVTIATVYLLSPPDAPLGSEPDLGWMPFVRHGLFWNLLWMQPGLQELSVVTEDFVVPLPGIGGMLVYAFAASAINDVLQAAWNMVIAHSLKGTFWTVTGGGSSANFPEVSSTLLSASREDFDGLDKDLRLSAERVAAANAIKAARLDPVFPYRARAFDLTLLEA